MTVTHYDADDGASLTVHIAGSGPDLVILHGWTSAYTDWRRLLERFEADFTCYFWEARPHRYGNGTVERMARDLDRVVERFSLNKPLVVAHSMGAMVAWQYVRQFGCQSLGGLCIIDQSPKLITTSDWSLGLFGDFTEADNRRFIAEMERDFPAAALDLIAYSRSRGDGTKGPGIPSAILEPRRERLLKMTPEPWIACWRSFSVQDYRSVLPRIDVPALLIYGGRSGYYGRAVADYVRDRIPASRLRVYPEAGHSPHVEEPDAFYREVVSFGSELQWG